MKRDDWMLLTLTFLTGLAIGMYVYIAAFKPVYLSEDLDNTEASADEWSVVGKKRGGDEENSYIQPSFRVLSDGGYTYLPGGSGGNALDPVEGNIAKSLLRDLRVSEAQLAYYEERTGETDCLSNSDGYDYRYRITLDGETYLLDTCYTTLGHDSDLAIALEEVWNNLEGNSPGGSYDTPSDWIQNWIYQTFRGE